MADYSANTTLRSGLVKDVVNITYTGGRKQSEILNEIHGEAQVSGEPEVPMSSTPEQVILYFEEIVADTSDMQKKHIYSQAIKWIKELEKRKADEVAEKIKNITSKRAEELDGDLGSVVAE